MGVAMRKLLAAKRSRPSLQCTLCLAKVTSSGNDPHPQTSLARGRRVQGMPSRSTYLVFTFLAWWTAAGVPVPVLARDGLSAPQQTSSHPQSRQNSAETYIVSFGLFGGESVFESEAQGAALILRE